MPSTNGIPSMFRNLRSRFGRRQVDHEKRDTADFLASVPLFGSLPRGMLLELADAVHHRIYHRDEFLYYQGDPGIGLFLVRSGSVRLLVEDRDGQLHEIRTAGEGEAVGVEGIVGDGRLRRRESVQSVGETRVMGIFSPEYRTLQRRHPRTGCAVATLLARYQSAVQGELRALLADRDDPVSAASIADDAATRVAADFNQNPGH